MGAEIIVDVHAERIGVAIDALVNLVGTKAFRVDRAVDAALGRWTSRR